jgi:putative ATP-binding cassette transporter
LYGGEEDEQKRLGHELDEVISLTREIANAVARLTWVTAGYGWFAIVAPIVVAAPGYFGGQLTFGELMMVVGAFNRMQQALRWYLDKPEISPIGKRRLCASWVCDTRCFP